MSSITDEIEELLSKRALDHSMTKESLQKMLDEINELTNSNRSLNVKADDLMERNAELANDNAKLREEIVFWTKKEDLLTKKEAVLKDREMTYELWAKEVEHQQIRVADHKEILSLLLRNQTISQSILSHGQIPLAGSPGFTDQFGSTYPPVPGTTAAVTTSTAPIVTGKQG